MGAGPLRRLGTPRQLTVRPGPDGAPTAVTVAGRGRRVIAVREDWLVQDLWWTDDPVDRHYYELVLEPGRHQVVYRDADGAWYGHP